MNSTMLKKLKNRSVLVIGDLMLDHYLYGETSRISPEAPVPVVRISNEKNLLGGAANVANNIASLEGNVSIVGVVGNDSDGAVLRNILKKQKIKDLTVLDDTRPTIIKKRIISGNNQQMIRLDYEKPANLSPALEKKVFDKIKKNSDVEAVILSDYRKGFFSEKLTKSILNLFNKKKVPVIVDGKPENVTFYKNCTVITPNLKEAIGMSGESQDILKMGSILTKKLNCNVFITRGAEGISVFNKKNKHSHVPPIKITKIFDVTGAGDTVVAATALCMAAGIGLVESAKIANYAAGIVIQKPGTSVVSVDELENAFKREISHYLKESIDVKQRVIEKQLDKIEAAAKMFIETYSKKNKIIAFGNGGSASDAQHLVGELVGRFKIERKGLAAIALTTDSSVVTAIANDYGYDQVFERQIEANANKGDVVFGISTSGNSPNVLNAIKRAKKIGCKTIGLTGKDGGKLKDLCDISIVVPSDNTPRIQEAHITIIHILCDILDQEIKKNEKFRNILR